MNDQGTLACFKAYDIRGRVPDDLDAEMARLIGRAFAGTLGGGTVAVGRDMRLTGGEISAAVIQGLTESGMHVYDLGLVGTEEVYFATFHLGVEGGVMVTASHNPAEYNGMKLVKKDAVPVSTDTGLRDIEAKVVEDLKAGTVDDIPEGSAGRVEERNVRPAYIEHLLSYVDVRELPALRIVANAGNGMAGPVVEEMSPYLPFELIPLEFRPDGSFPNGVPNPLLPGNRTATAKAVVETGADLGVAWDGDFDRCFLFDADGEFVEGYYLVGLLAQAALRDEPGSKIIHDPRLVWNTVEMIEEAGGVPLMNKSGHAFMKERMRSEDAAYGGEVSAHYYFRRFSYCDSGMIPWLLVTRLMGRTEKSLGDLVRDRRARFPTTGEINLEIVDPDAVLRAVKTEFGGGACAIDETDGVSLEFKEWRVNVRPSNTEPLVRVNAEARGNRELLEEKTQELLAFMRGSA